MLQALQQLREANDALLSYDLAELSDEAICEQIVLLNQQQNRSQAALSQRIALAHHRGSAAAGGFLTTASFLRHNCRLTPGAARRRVDADTALADHPAVAEVYEAGDISQPQTAEIAIGLRELPAELAAESEAVLLEAARHLDVNQLRQTVRRLRAITDPDGHAAAALARDDQQWLDIQLGYNGTTTIAGLLSGETGAALRTALDALDQPITGDLRTASRRRAENLGELLRRTLAGGRLPINGGELPSLTVTVGLSTLRKEPFSAPAELDFGDLLSADAARRIGCDAMITRVVVDDRNTTLADCLSPNAGGLILPGAMSPPHSILLPGSASRASSPTIANAPGLASVPPAMLAALPPPLRTPSLPLDVGMKFRLVPAHIRKALNLRDKGCVFDGCGAPPPWCCAHHVWFWADGGPTALWNLVLLCIRHHHYVHDLGWEIKLNPDGTVTTTAPSRSTPVRRALDLVRTS
jgi:Domain of unknown function (DUF222)